MPNYFVCLSVKPFGFVLESARQVKVGLEKQKLLLKRLNPFLQLLYLQILKYFGDLFSVRRCVHDDVSLRIK